MIRAADLILHLLEAVIVARRYQKDIWRSSPLSGSVLSLRNNKKKVAAIPAVKRPQVYSQKQRFSNPVFCGNLMRRSRHVYNSNYKNEPLNDKFVRTLISLGFHFRFNRRFNFLARMLKKVVRA